MGLGSYPEVGLAEARDKALAGRRLARSGADPIAARKGKGVPTFGELADQVARDLADGFRNDKHKAQWAMTLKVYAAPLREKPVDSLTTEDVLAVLRPIWLEKPETASRLRGRVERVLNAAKAKGYRIGENPAAWRGHLDKLLPKPTRLARGHHAAMHYRGHPGFHREDSRAGGHGGARAGILHSDGDADPEASKPDGRKSISRRGWTLPAGG